MAMIANQICLCFIFFLSQVTLLVGQDQFDVYIEKESAAFVVVEDPESIVEYFQSSQLLKNNHFQAALELLTDERFSLTSTTTIEEVAAKFNAFLGVLRQIDQVAIVIHRLNAPESNQTSSFGVPDLSVIFTAKDETVS